jgi:hypothetical protein
MKMFPFAKRAARDLNILIVELLKIHSKRQRHCNCAVKFLKYYQQDEKKTVICIAV